MEIFGVEIFATGKWNGDNYSRTDLDAMVAAFPKVGFQVPIKLGHAEKSGAPAYGWVASIRREGDKLLADFEDLDKSLYAAIQARRFDAVSCEIYWNLDRNGVVYPKVLKAVALLGAETPGVSGLQPLSAAL